MTNGNPQAAYDQHVRSIEETLRAIKQWFNLDVLVDGADWGDVGGVTEVDTQLKQVLDFIKSLP